MIYFLREDDGAGGGHVKIGWTESESPDPRRLTLQTGNPRDLVLLGTVPGTKAEESRLHEQFGGYRIRPKGEWFRGEPELVAAVRALILASGQPRTVKEELDRRSGCRHGLGGVAVAIRGLGADLYKVRYADWGPGKSLRLKVYPASGPEPVSGFDQLRRLHEEGEALPAGASIVCGHVIASAAALPPTIWPIGTLFGIPAEDCVLMSDWPIVCDCWVITGEAG